MGTIGVVLIHKKKKTCYGWNENMIENTWAMVAVWANC